MKILVYGGKGWIGQQFVSLCKDIDVIVSNSRVDVYDDVLKEVTTIAPDRVVCLIGRTSGPGCNTIDYLELPGKLVDNIHDNLYGPIILANVCSKLGIHMTYMGTGCIFTYKDEQKVFTETDRPNFYGSSYSIVKGYTDQLMAMYPNVLNVRIRMPITSDKHPKNFISKLVSYKYICSIPNSMTVLDELLPIMLDMVITSKVGTINLVNPGTIDHNTVLTMYKNMIDPSHTWLNMTQEEQRRLLLADRSNNELDTTLLQQWYPSVQPIHIALKNVMTKLSSL